MGNDDTPNKTFKSPILCPCGYFFERGLGWFQGAVSFFVPLALVVCVFFSPFLGEYASANETKCITKTRGRVLMSRSARGNRRVRVGSVLVPRRAGPTCTLAAYYPLPSIVLVGDRISAAKECTPLAPYFAAAPDRFRVGRPAILDRSRYRSCCYFILCGLAGEGRPAETGKHGSFAHDRRIMMGCKNDPSMLRRLTLSSALATSSEGVDRSVNFGEEDYKNAMYNSFIDGQ
jgi:hypothetical protein